MNPSSHSASAIPFRDRLLTAWLRSGRRGFCTLWRLLCRQASDTKLLFQTQAGLRFELDPWAYLERITLVEGFYETEVQDALLAHLSPDGVLWDIGANIGLQGLTAKKLRPSSTVVCFEPSPLVVGRLWRHRTLNRLDVLIVNSALSDRTGCATLYLGPEGNSGMSTLSPWNQADYTGTCLVPTTTGDALVAAGLLPAPTVIKIDVEGHESAVLHGLAHTLRQPGCRAVVFEEAATLLAPSHSSATKDLLIAAGFALTLLTRHEDSAHPLANFVATKTTPI